MGFLVEQERCKCTDLSSIIIIICEVIQSKEPKVVLSHFYFICFSNRDMCSELKAFKFLFFLLSSGDIDIFFVMQIGHIP